MTSGILGFFGGNGSEPILERLHGSENRAERILSLPLIPRNMGRFKYNGLNPDLLSAVITAAAGMNACQFANQYLFNRLGIPECESLPFSKLPDGDFYSANTIARKERKNIWIEAEENCSYGNMWLHIRPRDMCRFGTLYLNGGRFNGEQIISEQWIAESMKLQSTLHIGYMWYISKNRKTLWANGYGGQHIVLIPSRNMVISFTSKYKSRGIGGRNPGLVMDKFIYPMIGIS